MLPKPQFVSFLLLVLVHLCVLYTVCTAVYGTLLDSGSSRVVRNVIDHCFRAFENKSRAEKTLVCMYVCISSILPCFDLYEIDSKMQDTRWRILQLVALGAASRVLHNVQPARGGFTDPHSCVVKDE